LLAVAALLLPASAWAQPADLQVTQILDQMAAEGARFQPGRLHAMGPQGLSMVLDRLLPDTADPKNVGASSETVADLIRQLGDARYRVRQSATQKLFQLGPGIRAYLVEATRDSDAEVSWRAARILRGWQARREKYGSRHAAAFAVYLQGINDDRRLEELARRARLALRSGLPGGTRRSLIEECIAAVARSEKEEYLQAFEPLLLHKDVPVAVFITETVGRRFPALLLAALQSGRDEVVEAAIRWTPNCTDGPRRAEVQRILVSFFEGGDESRKFLACFPLMHTFGHKPAADYLLLQVQSGNAERRDRALDWIGDRRNLGRPASDDLLKVLRPLLESPDSKTRRAASRALAMYGGEPVVRALLPLLDDPNASIATEMTYRLLQQRDRAMLGRVLEAAARDDPNETIRKRAAAILDKLGQGR